MHLTNHYREKSKDPQFELYTGIQMAQVLHVLGSLLYICDLAVVFGWPSCTVGDNINVEHH